MRNKNPWLSFVIVLGAVSASFQAQVINSISPDDACFNGPTFTLTVNGSGYIHAGFGNTSTVRWNGVNLPTTYVSSTQLTATVDQAYLDTGGAAAITVFNQHLIGPPSTSNSVTFTVNTFASISSCTQSVCADGTSATIRVYSAINLSTHSVRWNSTTLSSFNLGHQGSLGYAREATVPGSQLNLPGSAQVRLRSSAGCDSDPVSVSMSTVPHISSISPTWRPLGAATFTLTVNGNSFASNAEVCWDGVPLPTTILNSTWLTATVDKSFLARLGTGTITVTGGACNVTNNSATVDVLGQTVTSISPTAIGVGASTVTLTVNGTNFSGSTGVQFNGIGLTTTYVSPTQVTAVVPGSMLATAGTQWVSVRHFYFNGTPQFAYSTSKAFTVQGPTLQRLVPDHIPAGSGSFTMTLRGTSLNSTGFVPTLMSWNGQNLPATIVDSSTLTVTVAASLVANPGTVSVNVIVPQMIGSRTTNTLSFTIDPPGISTSPSGWTLESGGTVSDMLVANNTLYITGNFDRVAPIVGGSVALSTIYGDFQRQLPAANGAINITISDGSGGWFIGGSFTTVGGFPHSNVAHILAEGVVDPYFNAQVDGPVNDLSISPAGTLFVAGDFGIVNQGPRCNLAGLNAVSGETTAFNPSPNSPIADIAAESTFVIALGTFTGIGGVVPRTVGLAALYTTSGDYWDWDYDNNEQPPVSPQTTLAEGTAVYFAGSTSFTARYNIDGTVLPFGTHTVNGLVRGIRTTSAYVVIYGDFTIVDGQPRGHVAMFDKSNGALQALDPAANGNVLSLDEDGVHLFAAGTFTQFAGATVTGVGGVLVDFGTPSYFDPILLNGAATTLCVSGSSVAMFGTFNAIDGVARKNLAAIDPISGSVLSNWQADASSAVSLACADANWLYVSGSATTVDGQSFNRLGRIGLVDGNIDQSWNPNPNSSVNAIALGPQSLFVVGVFNTIGGASRNRYAEINLSTGAATSWTVSNAPTFNNNASLVALGQGKLFVAGSFNNTGESAIKRLRSIDVATGAFTSWIPDIPTGSCSALIAEGDTLFVGGSFTSINGVSVINLAALRASDGSILPFFPTVDGAVTRMSKSGSTLFIGGTFGQVGGQAHGKVAALDLGNTQVRSWAPAFTSTGSTWNIEPSQSGVHVGGGITSVNGIPLAGLAHFASGSPYPTPVLSSLGTTSATVGSASFVLTLQGSSFTSGSAARFAGVYVPTAFVSATQLQATIDASLLTVAGVMSVDVIAPAPGAGVSQSLVFSVTNPVPSASSLNPTSAPFSGAAFTLSVAGTGFTTQSVVRWNGANLTTTYQSGTSLQAAVSTALLGTAGPASVTVFNPTPGGGISSALTFTVEYPVPGATSLSPPNVLVNSGTFTLTVNGGPFYASSTVRWDGTPLSTFVANGSQLQAQVPAGLLTPAGNHAIDVTTAPPGGGASGSLTFSVMNPAPQCGGISPTTATAGDPGFTMQVTGSAFVPTSVVRWNGASVPTSYVNQGLLSATIGATLLAAAGTISVDVQTPGPGGGPSGSQTFTTSNPVPSAASLSPSSVIAGGATFSLSVTGSGFNTQTVVLAAGNPMATALIDATHVSAQIPAALIASGGSLAISVTNPTPGGGTSSSLSLAIANPAPVLAQLTPPSIPAGGPAFMLSLTGSAFVPASVVQWNGNALATTFNSGTQLQAAIPADRIAFGGSAIVSVFNPVPGGGSSSGLPFSIVAPIVLGLSPPQVAPMTTGQAPIVVTVNGSGFSPASITYANETALSTFFSSSTQLFATLPSSLPAAQIQGGIVFSVLDGASHSNGLALRVGSGLNQGWIMRSPPNPAPGQPFALVIEGAVPSAPFALIVDLANPFPIAPFPDASANEVLALTPNPSALMVLFDGLGVFGPPQPVAFPTAPSGPAPGGRFVLSGLTAFAPPLGISVTLQAAYFAPSSPWGLHLTWGHYVMPF